MKKIWKVINPFILHGGGEKLDLLAHWEKWLDSCKKKEIETIVVTLWEIWNDRNNVCHNKQISSASVKGKWTINYVGVFKKYLTNRRGEGVGDCEGVSEKPIVPEGLPVVEGASVYCDAYCMMGSQTAGIGVAIRLADQPFSVTMSKVVAVELPLLHAELQAIRDGLCLAKQLGLEVVSVFSDCVEAVFLLNREEDLRLEVGMRV